jgi:hypothetical protein
MALTYGGDCIANRDKSQDDWHILVVLRYVEMLDCNSANWFIHSMQKSKVDFSRIIIYFGDSLAQDARTDVLDKKTYLYL